MQARDTNEGASCVKCLTDKSAIAEHVWTNDHPINGLGRKFYNGQAGPWS